MTNLKEYKNSINAFYDAGKALALKNGVSLMTHEELFDVNANKAAIAKRDAQNEAERLARKLAKEQARRERRAANKGA